MARPFTHIAGSKAAKQIAMEAARGAFIVSSLMFYNCIESIFTGLNSNLGFICWIYSKTICL